MLLRTTRVYCELCGGEDAPIWQGKHIDVEFCNKHKAKQLLFGLLKAHESMINNPSYFSKDNPTKQHYYGLLNRALYLIEIGIENEKENK